MVNGKSKTLKKTRKFYKRKPLKNSPGISIVQRMPSTGLPDSMYMKMRYSGFLVQNHASGALSNNLFKLNDLSDPDYTNSTTNHQPYYYDQMIQLYSRNVVYGVKVTLKMAVSNASTPIAVSMKAQPDTGTIATLDAAFERPYAKTAMVNGSGRAVYLTQYYDIAKLFGITRQALLSEDSYSAAGGTPTRLQYLNIVSGPPDGVTTAVLDCLVDIEFYVKWKDRIRVNQS